MKNAEEIEFKQVKGGRIEITMKLCEKRFHKCCLLLRKKNGERNGLKIIAAKNVKLDVIIDLREMRMCCKEKLGNCLSDGFKETCVA